MFGALYVRLLLPRGHEGPMLAVGRRLRGVRLIVSTIAAIRFPLDSLGGRWPKHGRPELAVDERDRAGNTKRYPFSVDTQTVWDDRHAQRERENIAPSRRTQHFQSGPPGRIQTPPV